MRWHHNVNRYRQLMNAKRAAPLVGIERVIGGENHDIRLGMAYAVWRCATVEFGDVKAVTFEFVNEQLIRRFVDNHEDARFDACSRRYSRRLRRCGWSRVSLT